MATTAAVTVLEPTEAPSVVAAVSAAEDHPHRKSLAIVALGYLTITTVLLGIGLLLTHPLEGSVGRWDQHVNEYLASHRTPTWNDITRFATACFNTIPVVAAATVLVVFLALRRHVREAAFIALALLLEITVFLSVTFLVARPRPDVVRLNSTPATSSFPSGHTAAATVLLVGIAVIVTCCTRRVAVRLTADLLAALVVAAVGFGRLYRGLHHPTDVFVGALLGLACLVFAGLAVRAHGDRWRARSEDAPEGRERAPDQSLNRRSA